jgi:hypothetical protein
MKRRAYWPSTILDFTVHSDGSSLAATDWTVKSKAATNGPTPRIWRAKQLDRSMRRAEDGRMTSSAVAKQGRATRERIVCAAADLIAERGAVGTSLDDVRAA